MSSPTTPVPSNQGTPRGPSPVPLIPDEAPPAAPGSASRRPSSASPSTATTATRDTLQSHQDANPPPSKDNDDDIRTCCQSIGDFFCMIWNGIVTFFCWLFGIERTPDRVFNADEELSDTLSVFDTIPDHDGDSDVHEVPDKALMKAFLEEKLSAQHRADVRTLLTAIKDVQSERSDWNTAWIPIVNAYKKLREADPIQQLAFILKDRRPNPEESLPHILKAIAEKPVKKDYPSRFDAYIGTRNAEAGSEGKYTEATLGRTLDSITKKANDDGTTEELKERWEGFFQFLNLDPDSTDNTFANDTTLRKLVENRDWSALVRTLLNLHFNEEKTKAPYPFVMLPVEKDDDSTTSKTRDTSGADARVEESETTYSLEPLPKSQQEALEGIVSSIDSFIGFTGLANLRGNPLKDVEPIQAWHAIFTSPKMSTAVQNLEKTGKLILLLVKLSEKLAPHTTANGKGFAADFCKQHQLDPAKYELAVAMGNWDFIAREVMIEKQKSAGQTINPILTRLDVYANQLADALLENGEADLHTIHRDPLIGTIHPLVAWQNLLSEEAFRGKCKDLLSDKRLDKFIKHINDYMKNLPSGDNSTTGFGEFFSKAMGTNVSHAIDDGRFHTAIRAVLRHYYGKDTIPATPMTSFRGTPVTGHPAAGATPGSVGNLTSPPPAVSPSASSEVPASPTGSAAPAAPGEVNE